MFMDKYILLRNGHFYYRMAVPCDLKYIFPFREIEQADL